MGGKMCSAVVLSTVTFCHAKEVLTEVSTSWTLGNVFSMDFKNQFVWRDGLGKNIQKHVDLTLDQAHSGLNVSLAIERVLVNPDCPIKKCKVCFGVGKVSSQHTGPILTQRLTSPCPACSGFGYDIKSCQLFKVEPTVVTVALPPGSRPGYHVMLPGEGHEVVQEMDKALGDLEVTVRDVASGNFKLTHDSMELVITMTVEEALNGFVYEEAYLEGKTLRLDRTDKVTIPGSKIVLKGHGLQKIIQPNIINGPRVKDDLIVTFELEPEGKEESIESDEQPSVITTQEDLNKYIEKQKVAAEIKFGRKFLKLLSKFNEQSMA